MAKPNIYWTNMVCSRGTEAQRTNLSAGLGAQDAGEYVFYNEDVGRLQIWNGTTWENMSGFDE